MIPEELRRKIARDFYETALRKDELSRLASRSSSEEAEHLELARALRRLYLDDLKAEISVGDARGVG